MKRFILDGVPRSGTTAISNAISMHTETFCAIERYQIFADHDVCLTPDNLGDESVPPAFTGEKQIPSVNMEILAHRERNIRSYGNKTPRYYFNALDICDRSDVEYLVIVRDPLEICSSWNTRAGDAGDDWLPDNVGLFSLMEFLQVCHVLANIDPEKAYIALYDEMFFDNWRDGVAKLFDFLGAEPTEKYLTAFEEHYHRDRKKKIAANPGEQAFFDTAHLGKLYKALHEPGSHLLKDNESDFRALFGGVLKNLDAIVLQYFESCSAYPNAALALEKILTDQSYFFARSRFQNFMSPLRPKSDWPHFNSWMTIQLFYRTAFCCARMFSDMTDGTRFGTAAAEAVKAQRDKHNYVFSVVDNKGYAEDFRTAFWSGDARETLKAAKRLEAAGLREDAQILRLRAIDAAPFRSYLQIEAARDFGDGEADARKRLDIGAGTWGSYLGMGPMREGF